MSQYNASGHKGWEANVAIDEAIAVKLSAGKVIAAVAATDKILGVTTNSAEAGEVVDVRLRSASGTSKGRAGGTIAVGDKVTATAAGKLITTVTAGNEVVGIAVEAAATDDFFEFMNCTGIA